MSPAANGVGMKLTVRPFLSVVVCVLTAGETGVARPRFMGSERPARPRRPWARFRASLLDAIGGDEG